MAYPSLADCETAAHQSGLDTRGVIAWAAINQQVQTSFFTAVPAFIYGLTALWTTWTAKTQKVLNAALPIDILYAYCNANGSQPTDPSTVLTWAQGAGFVNNLGNFVATPPLGYGYPPGSTTSAPTTTPPGPNTTPPPGPTTNLGIFDFGSFFGQVTTDPVGAVTTYPGAAGIVAVGGLQLLNMLKIRL